jgi:hypothetical protein
VVQLVADFFAFLVLVIGTICSCVFMRLSLPQGALLIPFAEAIPLSVAI